MSILFTRSISYVHNTETVEIEIFAEMQNKWMTKHNMPYPVKVGDKFNDVELINEEGKNIEGVMLPAALVERLLGDQRGNVEPVLICEYLENTGWVSKI